MFQLLRWHLAKMRLAFLSVSNPPRGYEECTLGNYRHNCLTDLGGQSAPFFKNRPQRRRAALHYLRRRQWQLQHLPTLCIRG